ncbi:unnamed protein product [Cylindrotheca closterium]|uniref:Uncharacterized protein n=1 Tax=Cylindrotheca closterium TaxID=2856 RepID=A0AAD2FR38_9STRA|nr:unnamed protein product [Cylindrotheca closterium]
MVASLSNDGTARTKSADDEDSEGMTSAATPVTNNVSVKIAATESSQEVTCSDVAEAFPSSSSSESSSSPEEQEETVQLHVNNNNEGLPSDEEASDLQRSPMTAATTPTTNNVTSNPEVVAAATTDVSYAFPIEEEQETENDDDLNSQQTGGSLAGVDIMDSSVASTSKDQGDASVEECSPSPSAIPPTTPSNQHDQVDVDMAAMEISSSPIPKPNLLEMEVMKKGNVTPDTSAPSDSEASSYTDDASSSSNFSSTSEEEEEEYSPFPVTLEDSFEAQESVTDGIVNLFMQQQQKKKEHKREDRRRKLNRRKELELSREQATDSSEEDDDQELEQSRRRPPSRTRRRPRDYSARHRQNDIQKTLHYNTTSSHRTNKNEQDGHDVVKENRKARTKPLNDDYMLQEEIWLNMFCNAVPSYVMDYFKAFGCVKQAQTPQSQNQPPKSANCQQHPQPFVTDEEYRKRQHRKQQHDRRRHFRSRMNGEDEKKEEEAPSSRQQQVPSSVSYDESDHGSSVFTGLYDNEDLVVVPKKEDVAQLRDPQPKQQYLELERPTTIITTTTTTAMDNNNANLSTILEEGESQLFERLPDVVVNYPPNQPPTFAC